MRRHFGPARVREVVEIITSASGAYKKNCALDNVLLGVVSALEYLPVVEALVNLERPGSYIFGTFFEMNIIDPNKVTACKYRLTQSTKTDARQNRWYISRKYI